MHAFDVVVIGAGAAGLFCAGVAGQSGLKVLLVDHTDKVAEKIRISGGGRCNFTNLYTSAAQLPGREPEVLPLGAGRLPAGDFIDLLRRHEIGYHEKHKGQLFCDRSAQDLITMLLTECAAGGVTHWQNCPIHTIATEGAEWHYLLGSAQGAIRCRAVVIATGGLSIPKIGATRLRLPDRAPVRPAGRRTRPALVPLMFDPAQWAPFAELSGLSLPVAIETGSKRERSRFLEDLLFTHRGLSGPAVSADLQLLARRHADPARPGARYQHAADPVARQGPVAQAAGQRTGRPGAGAAGRNLDRAGRATRPRLASADRPDLGQGPDALAEQLARWELVPIGTEGYAKAEVTAGGVDTRCLSSQTMESSQRGLYFIGEVVDVTGWLGGYNFQWAWASAHACAQALASRLSSPDTMAL